MPSDKPHVGARVSTKRRVIAGVAHSDTGTISRLEDGGYCVVKWDSDGESTSVLMMSLRPLAEDGYSEGFDDAVRVARVLNSVTTMPTPEPTILDESAVSEIEALAPFSYANGSEGVVLTLVQRDALCATVRHLRAALSKADQIVREGIDAKRDLQSQLEQLRAENERLTQEREAAKGLLSKNLHGQIEGVFGDQQQAIEGFRKRVISACCERARHQINPAVTFSHT